MDIEIKLVATMECLKRTRDIFVYKGLALLAAVRIPQ